MKKIALAGLLVLGGILTLNAQCSTVSSISETFDTWKEIDKCWKAEAGNAMLYQDKKRVVFYSMTSPKENMYLITPKIKAGSYTLTLDITKNEGDTTLEIYSIANSADAKTYTSISKPANITGDKKTFNISLKKDAHLGLKVLLNGVHQAVYLNDLVLKPSK